MVEWSQLNNMELNPDKFKLLQHGKNDAMKIPYTLPGNMVLSAEEEAVRDLGVQVDEDFNFEYHINKKITEARNKASWLLRTFSTRDKSSMLLIYKTYVQRLVEYCCPLWSPSSVAQISAIESIQRTFTSKIDGIGHLNYWDRLRELDLFSLQRRRERYSIILMWKMQKELIPNCIKANFKSSDRRGFTCVRTIGKSKYGSINTLIFNSFTSSGPAIFNVVPPHIKAIDSLTTFKATLDKWLQTIPDTPPTAGYVAANRNSIVEWINSRSN